LRFGREGTPHDDAPCRKLIAERGRAVRPRQSKHCQMVEWSTDERPMPKISGRLIVDLFPDGTVRMVLLLHDGDGDARPLTAVNLDSA
jgi:hypothetical protein